MMKSEFELICKRSVTVEQYAAIEQLYMSSTLDKYEFVKSIKPMLKTIPQVSKEKNIKKMRVLNRSGYSQTPNGCYWYIKYVELVDVDIRSGKYIVKALEREDLMRLLDDGYDLYYSTDYDFHYSQCVELQ